jgi:hypothetical protein
MKLIIAKTILAIIKPLFAIPFLAVLIIMLIIWALDEVIYR